jgi:UDP-glucose 4-epimerase
VVHLAAETTPGSSARHPSLEAGNLLPTLTLLEVLQDFPDIHLIYFSSGGTLYGNPAALPVAEDAPFAPLSFHGAGKAAQEMYLQAFRAQGQAVTILRPANAYGPGQPLKPGFGLVRTVLEHIRRNTVLEVWGDGTAVRDYVFVDDVAAACVRLIAQPGDNGSYNVGSGMGHSINELILCAGEVCGRELQVVYRPARRSDVAKVVLDISRLRAAGWQPQVDLTEGFRRTWEWLRRQP